MTLFRIIKSLVTLLVIFTTTVAYTQLTMSNGARFLVRPGTIVEFQTSNGILHLLDSSSIENNGQIKFKNNSSIIEQNGFPITGNGHEISFIDTLFPGFNEPANLGFTMNNTISHSAFQFYRFHSDTLIQLSSYPSILRYYSFSSEFFESSLSYQFNYDSTELNGLNSDNLKFVNVISNNISVYNSSDTLFNVYGNSDSLNAFTLTEVNHDLISLSDTIYCLGDSLNYNFASYGLFNENNVFTFWITNGTDTVSLHTSDTMGGFSTLIPSNINSGEYSVYLTSSSAVNTNQYFNNIHINELPIVTYPLLNSVCNNATLTAINFASPQGGIYSGVGINDTIFNPTLTGVGNFIIDYTYTDTNGCIASDTSQITVHPVDSVSFSPLNDLCENAPLLNLNQAVPSGGIYSGVGVSSNNFDPSIGVGNYYIQYSFSNSFGCTDIDSSSINVLDSPNIPLINQNINLLTSDIAFDYQWYYNGNVLSGETNQTISPLLDGFYFVEVFNSNGCSEFSDSVNFIFNSISENNNSIRIEMFPNPANDFIQFSVANYDLNASDFTFTDINGKLMSIEIRKNGDGFIANLQGISSGVYILHLQNENLVVQNKFIVIHP